MNMKYQPPKLTPSELLEFFPEAKEIIPLKIKECDLYIKEKEAEIQDALNGVYSLKTDEFSEWFGEKIIEVFMLPDLKSLEKRLFQMTRFLSIINPQKYRADNFQAQIETAKNYPIYELARDKLELKRSGNKFVSLCFFHDEKTPSLYLYPETNKFYCFGCQEKGDAITLTMALYGLDFKEAVTMLQH